MLEQGQGLADDVADGGSADIAEGVGEDIQRAQSSLAEKGEQGAFAVADLLVEDTAAGAGLARTATSLVGEAFGLGGLPRSQPAGEIMQFVLGEPGQRRVGQPLVTVVRAGRRSLSAKASRASQVVNRTGATPGSWP